MFWKISRYETHVTVYLVAYKRSFSFYFSFRSPYRHVYTPSWIFFGKSTKLFPDIFHVPKNFPRRKNLILILI